MPNLNLSSFHDYDVRGIYPTDIDETFFYHLGKSYALYIKNGPVYVGHDTRAHSPALFNSFVEGMTDYGVDVVDLGNISTEMHNFACGTYPSTMNVMITASHNPPEYNGVKSALHGTVPLHGGFGLPEVKAFMNQDLPKAEKKGTVTKKDIFADWIAHIKQSVEIDAMNKDLRVVVDAGNGMGGPAWNAMRDIVPFEIIPLFLEPDGSFPNHVPDPSKAENLQQLVDKVKETGADLGIAIDGDADRAVFVDETGTIVPGTVAVALLAEHFLHKSKGAILYDATCGRVVPETVEKNGGRPVRTRVGHSFIKTIFKQEEGIFAGENSGHFYFKENSGAESSLMAGLILVEILSGKHMKMSEIRAKYDIYPRSGETNFKVPDSSVIIHELKETYSPKAMTVDEVDGYSFWFKDWWFNVRLSKTEPLMRINVEADTRELLDTHFGDIVSILEKHGAERKK
jgi:phosphomannomutase